MYKTGTTALQTELARSQEAALADGLVYPNAYGANHSHLLNAVYRPDVATVAQRLRAIGLGELVDARTRITVELDALYAETARQGRDLLLSGEALSAWPQSALERVRGTLAQHFGRVVALATVRPPRSFARSAAQQTVKVRLTLPALLAQPPRPFYRKRFVPLIAAFGAQNVRIGIYAPGRLVNDCPLQTVLALLDKPTPRLAAQRAPLVNTAISMTAAKLMSALNSHLAEEPPITVPPAVMKRLRRSPQRKTVQAILDRSPAHLRWPVPVRSAVHGVPGPPFTLPLEVRRALERSLENESAYASSLVGEDIDALDDDGPHCAPTLEECQNFSRDEIRAIVRQLSQSKGVRPERLRYITRWL